MAKPRPPGRGARVDGPGGIHSAESTCRSKRCEGISEGAYAQLTSKPHFLATNRWISAKAIDGLCGGCAGKPWVITPGGCRYVSATVATTSNS